MGGGAIAPLLAGHVPLMLEARPALGSPTALLGCVLAATSSRLLVVPEHQAALVLAEAVKRGTRRQLEWGSELACVSGDLSDHCSDEAIAARAATDKAIPCGALQRAVLAASSPQHADDLAWPGGWPNALRLLVSAGLLTLRVVHVWEELSEQQQHWALLSVTLQPALLHSPDCSSAVQQGAAAHGAAVHGAAGWTLFAEVMAAPTAAAAATATSGSSGNSSSSSAVLSAAVRLLAALLQATSSSLECRGLPLAQPGVHQGTLGGMTGDAVAADTIDEVAAALERQEEVALKLHASVGDAASPAAQRRAAELAAAYAPQAELLACPEAAAAAQHDVRGALFDWLDPAAWKLPAPEPPGLSCRLFRYQRRALAWMMWREECGAGPLGPALALADAAVVPAELQQQSAAAVKRSAHTSRGGSTAAKGPVSNGTVLKDEPTTNNTTTAASATDSIVATPAMAAVPSAGALDHEAAAILGTQLLNPLWRELRLIIGGWPLHAAAAAEEEEAAEEAVAAECPHPASSHAGPPRRLVLYHAPHHGLLSERRPGGLCGPSGGVLADEMGLGKTVEVLALLLARPAPVVVDTASSPALDAGQEATAAAAATMLTAAHRRGEAIGIAAAATATTNSRSNHTSTKASSNRGGGCGVDDDAVAVWGAKGPRRPRGGHQVAAAAAAAAAAAPPAVWPAPGKAAGGTLVVTPPAILQQWAREAARHAPGLQVVVYDGLKWARAQAQAEARKQQGRLSKAARTALAYADMMRYLEDGPPDAPAFDAEADAAAAVAALVKGGLVLTTYDVLQQEVHFSGSSGERLASLRHKKRYRIPQSPLLQVHWWRAVFDEAQLVGGGLSATAQMARQLQAAHRWAVTGTPIGAGGLDDVASLLRLVGAEPFNDDRIFKHVVAEPFKASAGAAEAALRCEQQQQQQQQVAVTSKDAGTQQSDGGCLLSSDTAKAAGPATMQQYYGATARDGVRRLLALLQPLMWRSSKESAAADHPLPPRHLRLALLRMSPAERSFYNAIVDRTAAARDELCAKHDAEETNVADAAAMAAAIAESQGGDGAAAAAAATAAATAVARPRRRGGRSVRGKQSLQLQLQNLAAGQVLQLRLACIHPQLTSYWRELSSELQLRSGGALSISEILGRMRDAAQLKLQGTERELCITLNTLAARLITEAQRAEDAPTAGAQAGAAAVSAGGGSSKRRRGRGGGARAAGSHVDTAATRQHNSSDSDDGGPGGAPSARKRVRFAGVNSRGVEHQPGTSGGGGGGGSKSSKLEDAGHADGPSAPATPEELRREALKMLEQSYRVGEHGILALEQSGGSSGTTDTGGGGGGAQTKPPAAQQQQQEENDQGGEEALGDIAGSDATWRAWKHVGLQTAQSLAALCPALGLTLKQELYEADLARKRDELLETPTADVARASTKLAVLAAKRSVAEETLRCAWNTACAAGVTPAGLGGAADADAWLVGLERQLQRAKAREEAARQQHTDVGGTTTTVLLGRHVPELLEGLEGAAAAERAVADGRVGAAHAGKASTLLRAAAASAVGVSAGRSAGLLAPSRGAGNSSSSSGADSDSDSDGNISVDSGRWNRRGGGGGAEAAAASRRARQPLALPSAAASWSAAVAAACAPTGHKQQPAPAAAVGPDAAAAAAAQQFMDCPPERRLLARIMFRGRLAPLAPLAPATSPSAGSSHHSRDGTVCMAPAEAAALGALLPVFTAASHGGTDATGAAAARAHAATLLRHVLRLVERRGAALQRAYLVAAQPAIGADAAAAAAVAAAGGAAAVCAAALKDVPLPAAAAAGEAARGRVELCRLHRELHVAELELEVSQHALSQAGEEAAAAAAGQLSQLLAASQQSDAELRRSATVLIKRCQELHHHKRFLSHQAEQSSALAAGGAAARDEAAAGEAGQRMSGGATTTSVTSNVPNHADDDDDAGDAASAADAGDVECAVCRSAMSQELQVFNCGHFFCDSCAQTALEQPAPSCPMCRGRISRSSAFRVSLAGAGAHDAEVDPPEGPQLRRIKVPGSWMTKLEALLRRLLLMRRTEPTAKALVFSQFPDALALASRALTVLEVQHVSLGLGGGRDNRRAVRAAVRRFSDDPEVRVFLLSLRAGAAGLTLTSASRVYLLEPALDPAVEQQAVARVHRIGQTAEVVITRLLVKDSVEEQVLRISEAKQALLSSVETGVNGGDSAGRPRQQASGARHRQRRASQASESGLPPGDGCGGGADDDAAGDGDNGMGGGAAAATTLQCPAPRFEAVACEEVDGLLAAVMRQRGSGGGQQL